MLKSKLNKNIYKNIYRFYRPDKLEPIVEQISKPTLTNTCNYKNLNAELLISIKECKHKIQSVEAYVKTLEHNLICNNAKLHAKLDEKTDKCLQEINMTQVLIGISIFSFAVLSK